MIKMNEEEFKKSLNSFLEEKSYIVAYRSNYDSAREFNSELINYIKQLQKQNAELIKTKNEALSYIQNYNHMSLRYQDAEAKDKLNLIKNILNGREDYQDKLQNNWNELKKWLEDNFYWSYYEEDLSSGWVVEIIKGKMQELEQGKMNEEELVMHTFNQNKELKDKVKLLEDKIKKLELKELKLKRFLWDRQQEDIYVERGIKTKTDKEKIIKIQEVLDYIQRNGVG